jgi:hypothetical protein
MPSPLWLLAGCYLVVAAASLLEVDFRAAAWPPAINFCIAALVFAAIWPIRAIRGVIRAR